MTFSESLDTCFKNGLEVLILESNKSVLITLFVNLIGLAILIPETTVAVRRFHDTNRSAWNLLWGLLPFVGWILQFVYLAQPGTVGTNNYGESN